MSGGEKLAAPVDVDAEVANEQGRQRRLARLAVGVAPGVGTDELVAAVDAGVLADATDAPARGSDPEPVDVAVSVSEAAALRTARTADEVHRCRWPGEQPRHVVWNGMGTVIPVLGASPGAGASVLATVLTDALRACGHRVLLADTADPVRSGLVSAARTEGVRARGPHPLVRVRFSWRGDALLGRLDTELPVITPGMVPSPPWWRPRDVRLDATVVDMAHDAWRIATNPLVGVGSWLHLGQPAPRPVLVCRASRPSLLHAEQVLARLDSWAQVGAIAPVEHLVVAGARRWPPGVAGAAGRRLAPLIDHAIFLPHDKDVAADGVTAKLVSARLRHAVWPLLESLGLGTADGRRADGSTA